MVATEKRKTVRKRISPKEAQGLFAKNGYDITEKTIREWCISGEIRRAKKVGGRWHIPPKSVEDLC